MTAGNMLLEAAAFAGYYGIMTRSSGPQIRGGEAAALLRISRDPVDCMDDRFDVLATVDWDNVHRFRAEIPLDAGSLIVGDPDMGEPHEVFTASGATRLEVPLKQMAKAINGGRPNMLLLGLVATLLGLPEEAVVRAVEKTLAARPDALQPSLAAAAAGREFALGQDHEYRLAAPLARLKERWLVTGNEATGLGAIKGGIRFVAAYPITPATELLE